MITSDVYLKYRTYSGTVHKLKLTGYSFGEGPWITKFGKAYVTPPEFRVLMCKDCHSNNWSDDGTTVNEYCCDNCGALVMAAGELE